MGKFPQRGRNVSLVLSLTTGLVSPKFHIEHNPSFNVVKQESFKSNWQAKTGFITKKKQQTDSKRKNITSIKQLKQKVKTKKVSSHVSKKCSVTFVDPIRTEQIKAQGRNSRSSTEIKFKAPSSSPYEGMSSTKSYQSNMPNYATLSTTAETRNAAVFFLPYQIS